MKNVLKKILAVFFGISSVYLLVILQISLINHLGMLASPPNLLYILTFAFIFALTERHAILTAFFAGLIYDILSFGSVGITPFLILTSLLLFSFSRKVFSHTGVTFFVYYYLSAIVYRIISSGRGFSPSFIFDGFSDLIILLIFVALLRLLAKVFNPSGVIQLRFRELP